MSTKQPSQPIYACLLRAPASPHLPCLRVRVCESESVCCLSTTQALPIVVVGVSATGMNDDSGACVCLSCLPTCPTCLTCLGSPPSPPPALGTGPGIGFGRVSLSLFLAQRCSLGHRVRARQSLIMAIDQTSWRQPSPLFKPPWHNGN